MEPKLYFQEKCSESAQYHLEQEKLTKLLGLKEKPDSCNINYYKNKGGIAAHSDDEKLFGNLGDNVCIVSLSIGASAKFDVLSKTDSSENFNLMLHEGDILVMDGQMQTHYRHAVKTTTGERVNFT